MATKNNFFSKGTFKMQLADTSQYSFITLIIVIFILLVLFSWIFNKLGLQDRSCKKLDIYWPHITNTTLYTTGGLLKPNINEGFDDKFLNYYVKSAYNACCGDGYKNNFVSICALDKCIMNGCRFLDFEIYSYNNDPIVASSTANSNYIKETYNSLLFSDILSTIKEKAFNGVSTNCTYDPLILNFRVMSTNITMLIKMGDLIEEYLDTNTQEFSLELKKDNALLTSLISTLYKKVIIICDFNPLPTIAQNPKLAHLEKYINLKGKGLFCNTFRYNQVVAKKGTALFINETKSKFTIILPNLDNSILNFEPVTSYSSGCQAICMKHQNMDTNLLGYNQLFKENKNFSWIHKPLALMNESATPLTTYQGGFYGVIKFMHLGAATTLAINIRYNDEIKYSGEVDWTSVQVDPVSHSELVSVPITEPNRLESPTSGLFISITTTKPINTRVSDMGFTDQPSLIRQPETYEYNGKFYRKYNIPSVFNNSTITYKITTVGETPIPAVASSGFYGSIAILHCGVRPITMSIFYYYDNEAVKYISGVEGSETCTISTGTPTRVPERLDAVTSKDKSVIHIDERARLRSTNSQLYIAVVPTIGHYIVSHGFFSYPPSIGIEYLGDAPKPYDLAAESRQLASLIFKKYRIPQLLAGEEIKYTIRTTTQPQPPETQGWTERL